MKGLVDGRPARELRVCAELFDRILAGDRRYDVRLMSDAPALGEVVLFVREAPELREPRVGVWKRVVDLIAGSGEGVVDQRFCIFIFEDLG